MFTIYIIVLPGLHTGALMGLSSLAVMGNSLTLQLYKGPTKLLGLGTAGDGGRAVQAKGGVVDEGVRVPGLVAAGDALPV